ncbi:MAG: Asp-tRNA(Asn)/Glu-tRNA(Gln) amidotransferase subunit GatC [Deltaproteobacteria bacterium]|nr:Asp-tRNA(Asn)/Glu-tRNA(Gln) amidotransferase subunit GatC [Deltaproteobacteria bacterium]
MSSPRLALSDVAHLARLSRLALGPDELAALAHDLGAILDYVAELETVDVTDVPPMVHPLPFDAPLRADEAAPALPREVALAAAPAHDDQAFLVPRVL